MAEIIRHFARDPSAPQPDREQIHNALRLLRTKVRNPTSRPNTAGSLRRPTSAGPPAASPARGLAWSGQSLNKTAPLAELSPAHGLLECIRTQDCRCSACLASWDAIEVVPNNAALTPEAADRRSLAAWERPLPPPSNEAEAKLVGAPLPARATATTGGEGRAPVARAGSSRMGGTRCRLDETFASAASTSQPPPPTVADSLWPSAEGGVDDARLPLRHAWIGGASARYQYAPPATDINTPLVAPLSMAPPPNAAERERWEEETVAWGSDEEFDHDVLRPKEAAATATAAAAAAAARAAASPVHASPLPPQPASTAAPPTDLRVEVQRAALQMRMVEERVALELSAQGGGDAPWPQSVLEPALRRAEWLPPGHSRHPPPSAVLPATPAAVAPSPPVTPHPTVALRVPGSAMTPAMHTPASSIVSSAPRTSVSARLPPLRPLSAILAESPAPPQALPATSAPTTPAPTTLAPTTTVLNALVAVAAVPPPPVPRAGAAPSVPSSSKLESPAAIGDAAFAVAVAAAAVSQPTCATVEADTTDALDDLPSPSSPTPLATPCDDTPPSIAPATPVADMSAKPTVTPDSTREARRRKAAERRQAAARQSAEVDEFLARERAALQARRMREVADPNDPSAHALPTPPPPPPPPQPAVTPPRAPPLVAQPPVVAAEAKVATANAATKATAKATKDSITDIVRHLEEQRAQILDGEEVVDSGSDDSDSSLDLSESVELTRRSGELARRSREQTRRSREAATEARECASQTPASWTAPVEAPPAPPSVARIRAVKKPTQSAAELAVDGLAGGGDGDAAVDTAVAAERAAGEARLLATRRAAQRQLAEMNEQLGDSLRRTACTKLDSCLSFIGGDDGRMNALQLWRLAAAAGFNGESTAAERADAADRARAAARDPSTRTAVALKAAATAAAAAAAAAEAGANRQERRATRRAPMASHPPAVTAAAAAVTAAAAAVATPQPAMAAASSAVSQQVTELAMRLQAARALESTGRATTPRRRRWQAAAITSLAAHRTHRTRNVPPSPGRAQADRWFRADETESPKDLTALGTAADAADAGGAGHDETDAHRPDENVTLLGATAWRRDLDARRTAETRSAFVIETPRRQTSSRHTSPRNTSPRQWARYPLRKSDVPERLVVSTPPAFHSRGAPEADEVAELERLVHKHSARRARTTAGSASASKRRWQRLRAALKGRLRLGRSTERAEPLISTKRQLPLADDLDV